MLFDRKRDYVHLKNLMEVILSHTEYGKLDCMGISKTYKAFEWLQGLESKLDAVAELERENHDLKEALESESEGLRKHIEELETEIAELKKPKRKTRTRKK